MSMDSMIDLNKACGRELSETEVARLREIGNKLNLREDDALWPLLAAMEYQRVYYEALPDKIAGASKAIMNGMAAAAEKETAAAQARLTDSVVKEARNLALKIQYGRLVPHTPSARASMASPALSAAIEKGKRHEIPKRRLIRRISISISFRSSIKKKRIMAP